jgi:biopolymer transport protein ExbB
MLLLGTMGNNAPFIGLFGTVLGVIKAFHDLAQSGAGPEVVMVGLSEALVATAVGLLVALPCVFAFNIFTKNVKDLIGETESLGRRLAAGSHAAAKRR